MRTILALASSAFVAATLVVGPASAEDRINVTPPISREHSRAIRAVPPAGELTVTPHPVPAGKVPGPFSATASRTEIANR